MHHYSQLEQTKHSSQTPFSSMAQINDRPQQIEPRLIQFDDIECPIMFSLTWWKYKTQ